MCSSDLETARAASRTNDTRSLRADPFAMSRSTGPEIAIAPTVMPRRSSIGAATETSPTTSSSASAAQPRASTPSTITDWEQLSSELETVLERGWAGDAEELVVGEVSLAAPIDDRRGVTVGAIGISGPVERLTDAGTPRTDLVSFVREAARAVSRDLGAIPW